MAEKPSSAVGQVWDMNPGATTGPWSNVSKTHPGVLLVLAPDGESADAVPASSSVPNPVEPWHYEMTSTRGTLTAPIWFYCNECQSLSSSDWTTGRYRTRLESKLVQLLLVKKRYYEERP
jgi:hypothetical protein